LDGWADSRLQAAKTVKKKLATLQDRLDNALKDDYTALRQLEKTLPLSKSAKKILNTAHMRAYLEFSFIDEEIDHLDKIGFGAKIIDAYEMENGFIAVVVDWNSKTDSHKLKYASQGCVTYSSDKIVGVELEFCDYPYKLDDYQMNPRISVKLDYDDFNKKIDYVCFQNLKYQAIVYFAPDSWNCSRNSKKIKF
jgi:ferritin-like metal-binding protein YciE